jgi:hypothetical protein
MEAVVGDLRGELPLLGDLRGETIASWTMGGGRVAFDLSLKDTASAVLSGVLLPERARKSASSFGGAEGAESNGSVAPPPELALLSDDRARVDGARANLT